MRLIAWNCQHGSLIDRVARLAPLSPDIVFVQECSPSALPLSGDFIQQTSNAHKGIALGSLNPEYQLAEITGRGGGKAAIAATVTGLVALTVIGVWWQAPRYAEDVRASLDAYADIIASGRAVVMGDLNSGPHLNGSDVTRKHRALLETFEPLGLVSAYHVAHGVEHGQEAHATYRHQFHAADPWHIDFCFVPQAWEKNIAHVLVVDDEHWRAESDHHPLVVDLQFSPA
jgi:endonuclease/exonuclease/phosphatase family metal-dependent hydrolase